MSMPANPQIYHIVHVDRLPSILAEGSLVSDAAVVERAIGGTTIGMSSIKERRLCRYQLASHPGLFVGQCVPFYFCPRSVMLYLIHQGNHPELTYRDGQNPILHLEADLRQTVAWADQNRLRWAFTLSNAGSNYFEDRSDLRKLSEIDWSAVQASDWKSCKEGKQAEFLIEQRFPWELVGRIGVRNALMQQRVTDLLQNCSHRPGVDVQTAWYY